MVYVADVGSELDAPVGSVWKYLASGDPHGAAHRTSRDRQVTPLGPTTVETTMERLWRGRWEKLRNRLSLFPPLGYVAEALEGPMAGSKMFVVFTPRGPRTGIDVFGEFVFPGLADADVPAAALEWLAAMFDEDAPAVTAYARSTP